MSQNDLTIANQGFASFRSDLNSALQALGSTNSGTSAPSTTFANQLFYDTTNNILKIRNEDNDAFINLITLDQTNDKAQFDLDGTELILDADGDTSITADTDDQIDIRIGGSDKITINSSGRIGIGTTDIDAPVDIVDGTEYIRIANTADDATNKTGGLAIRHKTNSEEDFNIINGICGSSSNIVNIGGSDFIGNLNCATSIAFFTGANQTTLNGTSRMNINSSGAVTIGGSLSKGSGSFKIDHPLESKRDTHYLVHSFIEGPQADLIYRGKVTLSAGTATVNIDTESGMTEGTFVALNTDVQCFTSNESGWTAIKGSVSGNTLTITAQDNSCTDEISWMVIGERHDSHMQATDWTDSDGRVIVEPEKDADE